MLPPPVSLWSHQGTARAAPLHDAGRGRGPALGRPTGPRPSGLRGGILLPHGAGRILFVIRQSHRRQRDARRDAGLRELRDHGGS